MKKVLTVASSEAHARPGETLPYEAALRAAGIELVVLTPEATASLDGFAGLLLMGGTDVNPSLYGASAQPETDRPDEARDKAECSLIAQALAADLPVLAICRGMQILNVQHGGTLIQHLASVDRHRVRLADRALPAHPVRIEPGTKLARIADGIEEWQVNSRHHQAVERVGNGLIVSAEDPTDRTIEALERPDRRFVIAVQWHPENQSPVREEQARLFRAFADALD